MASKQPPTIAAKETEAEARVREAAAQMTAASDRHAAVVSVMSRLGVTPAQRRLAQSESKKIARELQVAKRSLRDAEAAARIAKARSTR